MNTFSQIDAVFGTPINAIPKQNIGLNSNIKPFHIILPIFVFAAFYGLSFYLAQKSFSKQLALAFTQNKDYVKKEMHKLEDKNQEKNTDIVQKKIIEE